MDNGEVSRRGLSRRHLTSNQCRQNSQGSITYNPRTTKLLRKAGNTMKTKHEKRIVSQRSLTRPPNKCILVAPTDLFLESQTQSRNPLNSQATTKFLSHYVGSSYKYQSQNNFVNNSFVSVLPSLSLLIEATRRVN